MVRGPRELRATTHGGAVLYLDDVQWLDPATRQVLRHLTERLSDMPLLVMLTGRERTADEFGSLFAKAGLRLTGVTPTHSPIAVIEARRA